MSQVQVKASPDGVPGAVRDAAGILAEELTYRGHGGDQVNGYLARPVSASAQERHPGIVVIHEAGGLGEHIRDVVNRFAGIGYVALGVDLYTREGGPPDTSNLEELFARLFSMSDAVALGDLEGAADLLRERDDVNGKIGCIGFCMGGRYTLLFAGACDRLNAAVDCWGGFIDRATPEQVSTPERPTPPLELAGKLSCPLYAAIGAEDHNPSPDIAGTLRQHAEASGQEVEVEVYEGAGHAFFADYRPTYRPAPAARLWERIVPFLARHLQAP